MSKEKTDTINGDRRAFLESKILECERTIKHTNDIIEMLKKELNLLDNKEKQ